VVLCETTRTSTQLFPPVVVAVAVADQPFKTSFWVIPEVYHNAGHFPYEVAPQEGELPESSESSNDHL
jgi:hypothetical protein